MSKILERLKSIWKERRHTSIPVSTDRRKPRMTLRQVDDRLHSALDDLEKTVKLKREDFTRMVANDSQQTVIFSTYREICRDRVVAGETILCRNKAHEAANTGIAKCTEQLCPVMMGRILKGAA